MNGCMAGGMGLTTPPTRGAASLRDRSNCWVTMRSPRVFDTVRESGATITLCRVGIRPGAAGSRPGRRQPDIKEANRAPRDPVPLVIELLAFAQGGLCDAVE